MEETLVTTPTLFGNLLANIQTSFTKLWEGVLDIMPSIIEGIIILIVGWVIAIILGKLVAKIVQVIRLDEVLVHAGVKDFFKNAGIKLNIDAVFEEIVKWFVLIVFFISAANAFGLPQVNDFLKDVLDYIPNVIIAVVIMIVGVLIAEFFGDLAGGTARATKTGSPAVANTITRYAVIVFTVIVTLDQLQIAQNFLDSFFNNLGLALAAAFGLAFGLGGKDAAAEIIRKIRSDIK